MESSCYLLASWNRTNSTLLRSTNSHHSSVCIASHALHLTVPSRNRENFLHWTIWAHYRIICVKHSRCAWLFPHAHCMHMWDRLYKHARHSVALYWDRTCGQQLRCIEKMPTFVRWTPLERVSDTRMEYTGTGGMRKARKWRVRTVCVFEE